MVVLISGNIDISFPAVAACSMYLTMLLATNVSSVSQFPFLVVVAAILGCLLGFINAVLVHFVRLPALIATLGTGSLIRGGLLAFVGTRILTDLPDSMISFSKSSVLRLANGEGRFASLATSVPIYLPWR